MSAPSNDYKNHEQRDIHIWASSDLDDPTRFGMSLLAGVWSNHGRLTYATLYKWLKFIIDFSELEGSTQVRRGQAPIISRYFLVSFEDILKANLIDNITANPDPRTQNFRLRKSTTDLALKQGQRFFRIDDNNPCKPGHYILYLGTFKETREANSDRVIESLTNVISTSPQVKDATMFTKCAKIVQADAGTRNEKTREHVRERDKCCVISKLAAMARKRGIDYTALEVAHIFPLALAEKAVKFLEDEELDDVLRYAQTRKKADCPENAMLLRSDLHRFFDQYQWSIYEGKIYVFESMYPKVLDPFFGDTVKLPSGVSEAIVLHHFRTCLSLRVAGKGYERTYIVETSTQD